LKGPTGEFWGAAFSPDGNYLVTANQDNAAWVWTAPAGQVVTQLKGSTGAVTAVTFSPDGRHVLAGSRDERVSFPVRAVRFPAEPTQPGAQQLTPDEEKVYSH
jgi:WD40 repeat protein